MAGKLAGKVAVITGGNSGIGLATAKQFIQEGAHVYITGRRQNELDAAVKELGPYATGVQGDVSQQADLDRLVATVKAKSGHIDVVYANAGVGEFASIAEVNEQHYDKIFDINVKGAVFTVQKLLPIINDGGAILLTGSVAGSKGFESFGVYNASKAAVRSFARTWANDLKGRKIRVNVISPGPIETPILAHVPDDAVSHFVSQVPLGRIGAADEIAKTAVFLASDDSSFVNGVELFVDGGLVAV